MNESWHMCCQPALISNAFLQMFCFCCAWAELTSNPKWPARKLLSLLFFIMLGVAPAGVFRCVRACVWAAPIAMQWKVGQPLLTFEKVARVAQLLGEMSRVNAFVCFVQCCMSLLMKEWKTNTAGCQRLYNARSAAIINAYIYSNYAVHTDQYALLLHIETNWMWMLEWVGKAYLESSSCWPESIRNAAATLFNI